MCWTVLFLSSLASLSLSFWTMSSLDSSSIISELSLALLLSSELYFAEEYSVIFPLRSVVKRLNWALSSSLREIWLLFYWILLFRSSSVISVSTSVNSWPSTGMVTFVSTIMSLS